MDQILKEIKDIEDQIEAALWSLEQDDQIEKAFKVYQDAETKLADLDIKTGEPAYPEHQRVLAYCLMRQSNLLRQMGKSAEALATGLREIAAARSSGDEISLARSLMSNGANRIVVGEVGQGLEMFDEARQIFEGDQSFDHQQGLGWYWILQADLANAGIVDREPKQILDIADKALTILKPIENWPGVARAYAARVKANQSLGNEDDAARDQKEMQYFEDLVASGNKNG